ncbi:MAG: hypothetical protein EA383_10210 [Spirochaetaceae bacterium]|nr:MAG: hypothetical protein EA383_10210 [Spirochaetaceae bacterium]
MAHRSRIEIIFNQSIEEDLFDRLKIHDAAARFTKIAPAYGRGSSGERRGDHIWPEENVMLLVYCDDGERERVIRAVKDIKSVFPNEGIKLFATAVDVFEL